MSYEHKDNNGNLTKLCDLDLSHLLNIINLIERKAEKGIVIYFMVGDYDDGVWNIKHSFKGDSALKYLNYKKYKEELERRNKKGKL